MNLPLAARYSVCCPNPDVFGAKPTPTGWVVPARCINKSPSPSPHYFVDNSTPTITTNCAAMAVATTSRPSLCTQPYTLDGYSGKKANVFRPPLSPTPSSPDRSRQQINSRKRSRASSPAPAQRRTPNVKPRENQAGYFDNSFSTSHSEAWSSITPNAAFESPAVRSAISPPPFVDTKYNLAYGVDGALDSQDAAESDYGRNESAAYRQRWINEGDVQAQDRMRQRPSEPNGAPGYSTGLTNLVFSFVSGVAGRMLDFCKQSTPFKGFYAGGGEGYTLQRNSEDDGVEFMRRSHWEDIDSSMQPISPFEIVSTPIPGQYPDSPPEDRATKRKKGDGGGWIMVPTPEEKPHTHTPNTSRPRLPLHAEPKRTPSGSNIPRPLSRTGSRRSIAPTMVARRHSSNATHAGSPTTHGRSASTASPRGAAFNPSPAIANNKRHSSGSRPSTATGHYIDKPAVDLSPDAQKYQARIKKQEREQDKSMRQMNAKLQDLIREGKAALGTKVDVEMDGMCFD